MRPRLLDLHGGRVLIDEDDFERVSVFTGWHVNRQGYAVAFTWKPRRAYLMHRIITDAPAGMVVDHLNGDKLDNRRANLRVTNQTVNQANRKRLNRNNVSGVRGVAYRPHLSLIRPWHAQIMVARKARYLGMFATREQAIEVRRAAEIEFFGEATP